MKCARLFIIAVNICIFSLSVAYAGIDGENNPYLLDAMYNNRENYIWYGGQSTGVNFYVERNSIKVEMYNPPLYIISMNTVYFASNGMNKPYIKETARYIKNVRYLYDFQKKRMYVERNTDTGKTEWEYVDSYGYDTFEAYKSGRKATLAAGEIAFYLIYHRNFYDKPLALKALTDGGNLSTF